MVDSFFSKPSKKRRTGGPSRKSMAPRKGRDQSERPATKPRQADRDEDITSDSELEQDEPMDVMEEESSEDEDETEADRRRRLAKQYLKNVEEETAEFGDSFDAADLDREIIARRLREDVAEHQGRIYRHLGDKLNFARVSRDDGTVKLCKLQDFGVTSIATHYPYAYTASKSLQVTKWDISKPGKPKRLKYVRGDRKAVASPEDAEHYERHYDEILCIAVSPDGKHVVTGGRDRRIIVWSSENLAPVKVFETKDKKGVVTGLAFRRGTNELFASCADLKMRAYNLDQMSLVQIFFGHQDQVLDISALGQPRCLTVGSRDRSATLWKVEEEKRLAFLGGDQNLKRKKRKFDEDAIMDEIDAKTGEDLTPTVEYDPVMEGSIDCCSMIEDQLFVTGSDNGNVALWSLSKKKPLYIEREAHGRDDAMNPSQVTASKNADGVEIPVPQPRYITSIYAIPYSDIFFTGSWSGDIRVWKLSDDHRKFSQIASIPCAKGVINRIAGTEAGLKGKETHCVFAAISKEHRMGRWLKVPGGKNGFVTAVINPK
ncbi:ribosomal RNA-processing protein 9 [Trichomonascus vanleenenianus]|uniref:ribosomal RNA-processing protein RRP9 n=1 Tax=Trichomonascus vanleenenianus TaxID=2268995 RepID=UPI003ECB30A2